MHPKTFWWAVRIALGVILAAGIGTSAQNWPPTHFHGMISDHPESANPAAGPWDLQGSWSLDLRPHARADFSAALTMEFSDIAATASGGAATDARKQHTHHITMNGATLIQNPPQSDCPAGITPFPTYTWQLEITGMADVTGNGGSAFGTQVPLQVCLGGGPNLAISNVTLVFPNLPSGDPSPATNHFGPQPIHGVVRIGRHSR